MTITYNKVVRSGEAAYYLQGIIRNEDAMKSVVVLSSKGEKLVEFKVANMTGLVNKAANSLGNLKDNHIPEVIGMNINQITIRLNERN